MVLQPSQYMEVDGSRASCTVLCNSSVECVCVCVVTDMLLQGLLKMTHITKDGGQLSNSNLCKMIEG
jgi:hypothetical protein